MATKKNILNDEENKIEYTDLPQLSKVKIGEQTYYLKDAAVRDELDKEIENRVAGDSALQTAIDAEETRAKAAEKANADAITAEATTARAAEKANADAITAIKDGTTIDSFGDVESALALKADDADLDALEGRVTTAEGEIDTLQSDMTQAKADIDALEVRMDTAETDIEGVEGRLDVIEGEGTGSIKKAVADEATARDAAIATAINALDVTDTAETGKYVSAVNEVDGKIVVSREALPAADEYTMVKESTAPEGLAARYYLTKNGTQVGANIDIAKDQFLKEAHFCKDASEVPSGHEVPAGTEFPAILFVFTTATGDVDTWVSVKELVDVYTAGNAIDITNNTISVKVKANDSYIEIDSNNQIATKGIDTAISTAVAGEAALREAADDTLQDNIDLEAETRAAADTALDERLDVIEGADTVDGSIKKALKDAKAYTDAEVSDEEARATAAEQANATAISNEVTRATGAEGALDTAKVNRTQKIAGIAYGTGDISVTQLQNAIGLEDLAYAPTASGTVEGQTISGVKATGSLSGSASLTIGSTSVAANISGREDYTPAGSITGSAISGGSINVTVKDADAATAVTDITYSAYQPAGQVAITVDNNGAFQVGGTNSTSEVSNFLTTPSEEFIKTLKAGTVDAATFTEGEFTPATLTYAVSDEFVKEGIKVTVGDGADSETLIFSDVTNKGTASVISGFSGGSKAADIFSANKLPVADAKGTAIGAITGATAAAQTFTGNKYAPSFTGTSADIKFAGAKYLKQEIDAKTFTPVAATLGFSGTTATGLKVTEVKYDKANASQTGSVSITGAELAVDDIVVAAKDVTVTPDEE